jgi:hypothetical protein
MFPFIDDVFSLNNSRFCDFVDRIYPIDLEINDTTDTDSSASYLDLHLEIDNEGRLRTKPYDKRDYFNFPIVNFPVYISQLIWYSKSCSSYQETVLITLFTSLLDIYSLNVTKLVKNLILYCSNQCINLFDKLIDLIINDPPTMILSQHNLWVSPSFSHIFSSLIY